MLHLLRLRWALWAAVLFLIYWAESGEKTMLELLKITSYYSEEMMSQLFHFLFYLSKVWRRWQVDHVASSGKVQNLWTEFFLLRTVLLTDFEGRWLMSNFCLCLKMIRGKGQHNYLNSFCSITKLQQPSL